jgi:hypothetical protein
MDEEELALKVWESGTANSKFQSYLLYDLGILGNKLHTWNSLREIKQSGWKGLICIRSRKGIARNKTEYNRTYLEAEQIVKKWVSEGMQEKDITFNQSMPDEDLTMQGEVMRIPGGLYLYGSFSKKPMNLALAEKSFSSGGVRASCLINQNLSYQSQEDLERLLDAFPNCAVEFSTYSRFIGNLPGRNTVFWEVRNY